MENSSRVSIVGMTRNSRTLAFEQGEAGQVLPLDTQHIETAEVRPLPQEQQLLEMWLPVRLKAADLPIQHRRMRPDGVSDLL